MSAGRPLLLLFLLALTPLVTAAQAPEEAPEPLQVGDATLELGDRRLQIHYMLTASGALFQLSPLVDALGAETEPALRGDSLTLRCGELEMIIGPGSSVAVQGAELVPLSQAPLVGQGGLHVPLDLLSRCFGDRMGYGFLWDAQTRLLAVNRMRARRLALAVNVVPLRGATTVALQFSEAPRYRIEQEEDRVVVQLLGDRIVAPPLPRTLDDALVRQVRATEDRVVLELAPGTEASSYTVGEPFRLVFEVYRARRSSADTADTPPIEPPRRRSGIRTIVIDPGHGGSESGAVGRSGAMEKDLTLALARALRRRLRQRLAVAVVLTRDDDSNLPLETRPAIANENKGDLFISLHLNSSLGSSQPHGAETYFLSMEASDEQAAESAEVENQAGGDGAALSGGGEGDPLHDLQMILWDLSQSRYLAESQRLAKLIQEELNSTMGLRDRGVKQAPFRVLMGAAMPAVLVEVGFLNNPQEEARLVDPAYQEKLVDAMVRAIVRYRTVVENDGRGGVQEGDGGTKSGEGGGDAGADTGADPAIDAGVDSAVDSNAPAEDGR